MKPMLESSPTLVYLQQKTLQIQKKLLTTYKAPTILEQSMSLNLKNTNTQAWCLMMWQRSLTKLKERKNNSKGSHVSQLACLM